jgi:hypothetical protein
MFATIAGRALVVNAVQQIRHLGTACYFGCGSAGFAYRHGQPEGQFYADPWAEYTILTVDHGSIGLEFRRVPFDIERLVGLYRSCGRPFAEDAIAQYGGQYRPTGQERDCTPLVPTGS